MKSNPLRETMLPAALGLLLIAGPATATDGTASLTITATVTPDCALVLSTNAIDLGSISATTLKNTSTNSALGGLTKPLTVTSTCTGTTAATLTLSTTNTVTDGYIVATEGDVMRFGVDSTTDTTAQVVFDSTSKSAVRTISSTTLSTGYADTFNVYAVAGTTAASSNATAGTYTAAMNFTLAPQ